MKNISQLKAVIVGRSKDTENYERALSSLGAQADTLLSTGSLLSYDALLLPGGADITPAFFGQKNNGSRTMDTELDILQIQALEIFVKSKKPVLGICKGIQIINIFFGGSLHQHLDTAAFHEYRGGDQLHPATALPGSLLHRLYGSDFAVNSAHHQGIHKLGHQLRVTQYAPDGVIEGIEHDTLPVWGVQWHPERLSQPIDGLMLLEAFLSSALL